MRSFRTRSFRQLFEQLPQDVQAQAYKVYQQFKQDPDYPGLQFKPVGPAGVYSARIGRNYRVLGVKSGDEIVWFWIGTRGEYGKLLEQMRKQKP